MKAYFTEAWKIAKASRLADKLLIQEILKEWERRYDAILATSVTKWWKGSTQGKEVPRREK